MIPTTIIYAHKTLSPVKTKFRIDTPKMEEDDMTIAGETISRMNRIIWWTNERSLTFLKKQMTIIDRIKVQITNITTTAINGANMSISPAVLPSFD